jgi:hypothetical protein
LKQGAITLWLIDQPDEIKEGVIELTNVPDGFEIATTTVPLSDITAAWSTETSQSRTVFLV